MDAIAWVAPKDVARVTGRSLRTVYDWVHRECVVCRRVACGRALLIAVDSAGLPVDPCRIAQQ